MSTTFYKGKDKLYKYAFTENISKDKSIVFFCAFFKAWGRCLLTHQNDLRRKQIWILKNLIRL